MTADLPALSARLREATGKYSDEAILLGLCEAFGETVYGFAEVDIQFFVFALSGEPDTSLDAALALARLVFPGCGIRIWMPSAGQSDRPRVTVWGDARNPPAPWDAEAATPALAVCLALVEWRIAHPC